MPFEIRGKKIIPSLNGTLIQATSRRHGTDLIHLSCSGEAENSFAFCFRTPCEDNRGTPHILEHMLLQGSDKYPVKDLYIELEKRCLATYAYGNTGSNRTVYLCSCIDEKQYSKLVPVFFDALFNPILKEEVFRQEGWRLEFKEPNNPESPLIRTGAVYNEMKGVALDQYRHVCGVYRKYLYPDTSLGKRHDGDFRSIPELSYGELIDYHRKYYNPGNCCYIAITGTRFEDIAQQLDNELAGLAVNQPPNGLSSQKPFLVHKNSSCQMPGKPEDGSIAIISWVIPVGTDPVNNVSWSLLMEILCNHEHSPLKKALVDSGYGTSVFTSFNRGFRQSDLSMGLYGVDQARADDVLEILRKSLRSIAEKGLDSELVEKVISLNELKRREKGQYWSESMLWKLSAAWAFDEDIGVVADSTSMFITLRDRLACNPDLFGEMIREHLLKNNHRIDCSFYPDQEHFNKMLDDDRTGLDQLGKSISEEEKRDLISDYRKLQHYLNEPLDFTDLTKLPIPDLIDLEGVTPCSVPYRTEDTSSGQVLLTSLNTSGICYVDLCLDVTGLSRELLEYAALYTDLLTRVFSEPSSSSKSQAGTSHESYIITATSDVIQSAFHQDDLNVIVRISGKCLPGKLFSMLSGMEDILVKTFSQPHLRILPIMRRLWNERKGDIDYWGEKHSLLMARSSISAAGYISNLLGGIPSLRLLSGTGKAMIEDTVEKLSSIGEYVQSHAKRTLVWSGPEKESHHATRWFESLPDCCGEQIGTHLKCCSFPGSFGIDTGNATSSAGMALKTVPRNHPLAAAGSIVMEMMDECIIKNVMLKGGAYAAGGYLINGEILLYSYRDPSPTRSLSVFRNTIETCGEVARSKQDRLSDYILSAVKKEQKVHRAATANQCVIQEHFSGDDNNSKFKLNKELLKTSFDSVQEYCSLLSGDLAEPGVCIIGREEVLNSINLDEIVRM